MGYRCTEAELQVERRRLYTVTRFYVFFSEPRLSSTTTSVIHPDSPTLPAQVPTLENPKDFLCCVLKKIIDTAPWLPVLIEHILENIHLITDNCTHLAESPT